MSQKSFKFKTKEKVLKEVYEQVAKEMNLPANVIEEVFNSQFLFAREELKKSWGEYKLKGKYNYNFDAEFPVLNLLGMGKLIPSSKKYKAAYNRITMKQEELAEQSKSNNNGEQSGT